VPKIISERCELVKLGHINRNGPVFLRHSVYYAVTSCKTRPPDGVIINKICFLGCPCIKIGL